MVVVIYHMLQVLQSDGGNLAACINAATLALVDAGVSLKGGCGRETLNQERSITIVLIKK